MTSRKGTAIRPETSPLYPSSVYTFPDLESVQDYYADNEAGHFLYRRNGHPNQIPVESIIADLEGAPAATLCASGMAAISQACFAHLKPGDHMLSTRHLYGGTYAFFEQILRPWGVDITYHHLDDTESLEAHLRPTTRLIYGESIANPLLQVMDIMAVGAFAQTNQIPLVVDNTFATPWLLKPLDHGATMSVHSLTKYLNGHSDVLGGVVTGTTEAVRAVERFSVTFGATLAPFDAWQTERGLRTFHLRMPAQCENALQIAHALQRNPAVKQVYYPGLSTHPSHSIAAQVLRNGFGAMVSFEVKGGYKGAADFVRQLHHIRFAPSLGGVHTTLSHPGLTSHRAYSPEERAQLGIHDGLIRLSVGAEPLEAILKDLSQALHG